MSDELVVRAEGDALAFPAADGQAPDDPFAARRVDVRLVRFGEVAEHTLEGIRERIAPGAFRGVEAGRVTLESSRHGGALVGVAESIVERADGAYATFRVSRTPAGDELLELARDGVLRDASISFAPVRSRPVAGGIIERQSVDLRRVAILERGSYRGAQVLAVRGEDVDVTTAETAEQTVPAMPAVILERMDGLDRRIAELAALAAVPPAAAPSELIGYGGLGEYAMEVWRGNAPPDALGQLLHRTQADQITTNNEGVIGQPGWVQDVKRIVDLGRRAITAMGGPLPLPPSGMEVKFPFYASANTLIAAQSTQKTEVQSARVDIDDGSAALATYAGYSDISIQLLERSSPSYIDAYERIMLAAWGRVTDDAFVNAMEAASGTSTMLLNGVLDAPSALATSAHADDIFDTTPDHGLQAGDAIVFTSLTGGDAATAALVGKVVWVIPTSLGAKTFRVSTSPGGSAFAWGTADISAGNVSKVKTTALQLRAALAQASVTVESATGSPASVALASTDVFLALAGLSDIVPSTPSGNPSNASGTMLASELAPVVSGLRIIHASAVNAGTILLTNPLAAAWYEQAPRWMRAADVALLGQDVGVYSYGAPAIFAPAGIVEASFV